LLNTAKILKMFRLDCISGNKPVFYFFILLIPFLGTTQQNLVPNASFEEYWQCPVGNDLNDGQFERCKYWWKPTMGTSDYYNSCNTGTVGVPNNFWGYQNAFHGSAYAGFGAISWDASGNSIGNEYLRTEIFTPLKACYIYKFTMHVTLAEVSTHGVGRLGAWFSKENNFTATTNVLNENPQILNQSSPIIDTSKWTKIEGVFTANGLEKFLTIGYFRDNVNLDTSFVQDFGFGSEALYFVDSISLIEIGPDLNQNCMSIDFPNCISPNNDGVNDVIDFSLNISLIKQINIINRWGVTVAVLNEDNSIWDGRDCKEGTYFYCLEYKYTSKKQTGFIQLIR
jgi:gliding motility-associated-like protein